MKSFTVFLLAIASMLVASTASASTAGAVTAIGAAAGPIAAIGAAVLLVLVGVKVIKWVRRAL